MKKDEIIAKLKTARETTKDESLKKELDDKINKLSNNNTVDK